VSDWIQPTDHGLPDGYDAADLFAEAGEIGGIGALPAVIALLDGDEPRRGDQEPAADDRRSRIPSGDHHRTLLRQLRGELEKRGYAPDAVDGWRRRVGGQLVTVSLSDLSLDIWLDLLDGQGISYEHVAKVFKALMARDRSRRRAELLASLTGRKATAAGFDALMGWVQAVTGKADPIDVTVMRHWLWLVKRRACGLPTEHDLMPIVYGDQGSGKSTATERLALPWAELVTTINATSLTDERRYRVLGQCVIGRWEEMQGAAKAEIEALKHTITAPTLSYRELHSHTNVVTVRSCSFIGTSNNSVDVMIGDTTGARRFYQLTSLPVCDHAAINDIDPALIWQGVSEHEEAPILQVLHVVREAQAVLVHRDSVSMWLEAEDWGGLVLRRQDQYGDLAIPVYQAATGESFEFVAARFRHWCGIVGQSPIGPKEFARRLKQERFTSHRPETPGQRSRPRLYLRPLERLQTSAPVDPGNSAPTSPAGAQDTRPPRFTRLAGEPQDTEDQFSGDMPPF